MTDNNGFDFDKSAEKAEEVVAKAERIIEGQEQTTETEVPPQQPQYDAPQQPQYGAPQQPQYGAPQQPQYGAPQQPQYGAPQQPQYGAPMQPMYEQKSKLAAGLLGIFLGGWGIHNFYLGYTNRAIIQIVVTVVTCGVGSLWGFIEGIMILCEKYNNNLDAKGVPLKD